MAPVGDREGAPHLEVVDQAVLGAASREPVYVAVVRNDDRRRAALGVAPRLRIHGGGRVARLAGSGPFDHPANVPPGGTAVAVDRLRAVPVGKLAAPRFRVGAFRRASNFPVEQVAADLDPRPLHVDGRGHRLAATRPSDPDRHRPRGGRIAGGGDFRLDEVPRGRSTHELGNPGVRSCGAEPTSVVALSGALPLAREVDVRCRPWHPTLGLSLPAARVDGIDRTGVSGRSFQSITRG